MKQVKSLCPECLKIINALILEENGEVVIKKTCPVHGEFKDVYWSDSHQYRRFLRFWHDGEGVANPLVSSNGNCPFECGVCPGHKTTTILANIDVTNRCNQRCPVCFANAAASGYLYEPSKGEIRRMMELLRSERPVPCPAIQFAGGEPTMREDIVELVEMAEEMGFAQIQMATNGVKLAQSLELCQRLNSAGLRTIYLQFDGVDEAPYHKTRGYNALPLKLRAIENCRKAGLTSVTLVPTLAKGVNDDQVGKIIRFALENLDVIKAVNFQPVSFTGRINQEERLEKRITIPDLFRLIEEQTQGEITGGDFYPVPFVTAVSHFVTAEEGEPNVEFTVHPHCGTGTYVYYEDGRMIPITRFIDVEGLMEYLDRLAQEGTGKIKSIEKIKRRGKLAAALPRFIDTKMAPKSVDFKKLFLNIFREGSTEATREFHRHTLFLGAMHFMDLYNLDLERVQRCGIHYATPDGRIIPFCTYNSLHRQEVERKFVRPLAGNAEIS